MRTGIALVGIAAAGGAAAETTPYYLGASEAFDHENNLYRVALGQPQTADSFWTTTLLGGINQPFGRNRFYLDATVANNHYVSQTQLDNTSYTLATGLNWESVNRLSGQLGYTGSHTLAPFGLNNGVPFTSKSEQNLQDVLATLNYGLDTRLSILSSLRYDKLDFSEALFNYLNISQEVASLGMQYRPSGLLTLGAAFRYTKGDFPDSIQQLDGSYLADKFHRADVDLTATWVPSGLSTVNARISYTREEHNEITARNVSGATGLVSWDYKATSKLLVTTTLSRDTGAQSAFNGVANGSVSLLSNTISMKGQFDLTPKVSLLANAQYVRRDLVGYYGLTSGASAVDSGYDKYGQLRLGVNYAPARNWLIGCSGGREKRGSHSDVSYAYADDSVMCSVQVKSQ
jgi:hypothetical protein